MYPRTPTTPSHLLLEFPIDGFRGNLCLTCGTCTGECPVHRHTHKLPATRVVRMARLGLWRELLPRAEPWYCIACHRCSDACPMAVGPSSLMAGLRTAAVASGVIPGALTGSWRRLRRDLQRVRWRVAGELLRGERTVDIEGRWDILAMPPSEEHLDSSATEAVPTDIAGFHEDSPTGSGLSSNLERCLACGECASVCPVHFERAIFDPMWIIRTFAFGGEARLLKSAAIWLCVECRSCLNVCAQQVGAHRLITGLRSRALATGRVDHRFPTAWKNVQAEIFNAYENRLDQLLEDAVRNGPGTLRNGFRE